MNRSILLASNGLRRLALLAGAVLVTVGSTAACSSAGEATSASTGSDEALTAINRDALNNQMAFLATTTGVAPLDAFSADGVAALDELNQDTQSDTDLPAWIAAAGDEQNPQIVQFTMPDGSTGILASRNWKGSTDTTSTTSALTLVERPTGGAFVYAERHTTLADGTDTTDLFLVDGGLKSAGSSTFDPSTATSTASTELRSPDALAAAAATAAAATDAGTDAGSPVTIDDGGAPALSNSTSCDVCADSLLAAKILGLGAAYATGTGAATAVCALVGIPTAEVGGVACHLVFFALSAGAALPFDFTGRAEICNWASNSVLGLAPVCADVAGSAPPTLPGVPTGSSN